MEKEIIIENVVKKIQQLPYEKEFTILELANKECEESELFDITPEIFERLKNLNIKIVSLNKEKVGLLYKVPYVKINNDHNNKKMEDNLIKCNNIIQLFGMSDDIEIIIKQIHSVFNYEQLRLGFFNERIQNYEEDLSEEGKLDLYYPIRNIQMELYIQILEEIKKKNTLIAYEKFKQMIYLSKEKTYFSVNEIVLLNDLALKLVQSFN